MMVKLYHEDENTILDDGSKKHIIPGKWAWLGVDSKLDELGLEKKWLNWKYWTPEIMRMKVSQRS